MIPPPWADEIKQMLKNPRKPEKQLPKLTIEEADRKLAAGESLDGYDVEGPNENLIRRIYESTKGED
jgi:hypothetical protein